jgi:TIR domain
MTPHNLLRTKIFISYSHQDVAWLERLRVHLRPLERDFGAEIWDDTMLQGGAKWREEIERALGSAAVAILLISADFLGSDFIAGNELPSLLKAAEEEGTVILPIILSHSGFMRHQTLFQFQAFNPPSKPLLNMSRGKQEAVLEKVAERVTALLGATLKVAQDQQKVQSDRTEKREQTLEKLQTEELKPSAAWTQDKDRAEDDHEQMQREGRGQTVVKKNRRKNYWPALAILALTVLAIAMVLAVRQFGNRAEGKSSGRRSDLSRSDNLSPRPDSSQAQRDSVSVTIERGGAARVFDDSLRLQLEAIRFDAGSNQYLVTFRLSTHDSSEIRFRDAQASGDRVYTYPAEAKFKIHLLSAEGDQADFSIEEMFN